MVDQIVRGHGRGLDSELQYNEYGSGDSTAVSTVYITIAVTIFIILAGQLLFPSNRFLPIDRRTSSISCAVLVYCSHKFLLKNEAEVDLIEAVDFDVLLLLSAIMIINHIIVHLKETKATIRKVQVLIQENPLKGFWLTSFVAFAASPFLTNDGVCLLLVAPILAAFEDLPSQRSGEEENTDSIEDGRAKLLDLKQLSMPLQSSDAVYFMLTLACSSNIGSALTYTGNPQNMIVASDSLQVLPPVKFLMFMFFPAVLSWLGTTWYISHCWVSERRAQAVDDSLGPNVAYRSCCPGIGIVARYPVKPISLPMRNMDMSAERGDLSETEEDAYVAAADSSNLRVPRANSLNDSIEAAPVLSALVFGSERPLNPHVASALSPLSPPRGQKKAAKSIFVDITDDESVLQQITRLVISPFPYMILGLLFVMIVMIFVDVMAISALVCISALCMVLCLVFGNHWKKTSVWVADNENDAANAEQRADGEVRVEQSLEERGRRLDEFFEDMFNSIDYNLLYIFLGLFVVVANMESTGLPKKFWDFVAGETPFQTTGSIISICMFVAIASQFLGNVAICQLAKPRVTDFDDDDKRLAWALISFVSTVAGNLTLTGSAANLIVAEKSSRIDRNNTIDFWRHIRVCCGACILSCLLGGSMIVLTNKLEVASR